MKYLLVDDDVSSLKFGGCLSDQSLLTDTELEKCEPDLSLTQTRGEKILKSHLEKLNLIKFSTVVDFPFSLL